MKALEYHEGLMMIHKKYNLLRNGCDHPIFEKEWDEVYAWRNLFLPQLKNRKSTTQGESNGHTTSQ